MIGRHFKRALADLARNRLVGALTVATIALAILIVGAAALFVVNTRELLAAWQAGARIVAYLKPGIAPDAAPEIGRAIEALEGVGRARYVSSAQALSELREQLALPAALFENLAENPIPASFEIELDEPAGAWERLEAVARRVAGVEGVDEVDYGRKWVAALERILGFGRRVSVAAAALFLAAVGFIVANTVRIAVHGRREEVEIMRLVGATEWFIRAPFYIVAMLQGLLGSLLGLGALFAGSRLLSAELSAGGLSPLFGLHFLPAEAAAAIAAGGTLAGWVGCRLALGRALRS